MIENILYQFTKVAEMLGIFFFIITLVGFIFYFAIRKLSMNNMKIKLYGLLLDLRDIDLVIFSTSIAKTFVVMYCAISSSKEYIIFCVIIAIATIINCLYNMKRVIFEVGSLIAQIFAIYLIKIIHNYQLEVDNNIYVQAVSITLTTFLCLYAIYIFLVDIEEIMKKNKNVRRNLNEEN